MFKKWLGRLEDTVTRISDEDYSRPPLLSLTGLLSLMSAGYKAATSFHSLGFEKGIFKLYQLPCPVISIGNIVAGGTGKTPMTIFAATVIKEMNLSPVILSRGYQGSYDGSPTVVSDGEKVFLNAEQAGDEPCMMARILSVPVVIGKDRYLAGLAALDAFNPDVFLLDDGFQHRKLKRDINLLLLDHSRPLGNGRLLPAGRLRESFQKAVARADALIFTRCPEQGQLSPAAEEILSGFPEIPWFKTRHVPFLSQIEECPGKKTVDQKQIDNLKGLRAVCFSGIAQNRSFFQTLEKCGIIILDHLEFKDHYRYKRADIDRINTIAVQKDADIIITTQKDDARLLTKIPWKKPFSVVDVRIEFEKRDQFVSFLSSRLAH